MSNTTQDFVSRMDVTALTDVSGSEFMQLIQAAYVASNKGLRIVTQDTALDTPDVPNPDLFFEGVTPDYWRRYKWARIPFATGPIKEYNWNETIVTPDSVYLKWELLVDTAALQTEIDQANTNATTALNTATAAETAATAAQTTATSAQTTANAAQTTANTANATANTAVTNTNNLQTQVTVLQSNILTLSGDVAALQTNLFRVPLAVFYLRERKNQGINGETSVADVWTKRLFTDIRCNNENLSTYAILNADSTFDLIAGKWGFEGEFPANFSQGHQTRLFDNTNTQALYYGTSEYGDTTFAATKSKLENYTDLGATTNLQIDHKVAVGTAGGFGHANNFANEIYGLLKLYYYGPV